MKRYNMIGLVFLVVVLMIMSGCDSKETNTQENKDDQVINGVESSDLEDGEDTEVEDTEVEDIEVEDRDTNAENSDTDEKDAEENLNVDDFLEPSDNQSNIEFLNSLRESQLTQTISSQLVKASDGLMNLEDIQAIMRDDIFIDRNTKRVYLTEIHDGRDRSVIFDSAEIVEIIENLAIDNEQVNETGVSIKQSSVELIGAAGIGPAKFLAVINVAGYDTSFIVECEFESMASFDKEDLVWHLSRYWTMEHEVEKVYKDVNTLWLEYLKEDVRVLNQVDHELDSMEMIIVEADQDIVDVLYTVDGDLEVSLVMADGQELKQVELPFVVDERAGNHYIKIEETLYKNGKVNEHGLWYRNYSDIRYFPAEEGGLRISNQGLSIKQIDFVKRDRVTSLYRTMQEGDIYLLMDEEYHCLYGEDLNGGLPLDSVYYEKDFYGGAWSQTLDGEDIVYIDGKSKHLMHVDADGSVLDEIVIPSEYSKGHIFDEVNTGIAWTKSGNGVVIVYEGHDYRDKVVYYSFDDEVFTPVEMPITSNVSIWQNQVTLNDVISYRFNPDSLVFETFYKLADNVIEGWYLSDVLYDGIMYYDDNEDSLYQADESLLENPDFLPRSELPVITYEGKAVELLETSAGGEDEYVLVSGDRLLGRSEHNVFTPIADFPVRCFDGSEYGLVFSGYEEKSGAYYYDKNTGETFVVEDDGAIDDIQLIGDVIVTLVNGKDLKSYDLEGFKQGESYANLDLMKIPGYEGGSKFRLDDNESYLAAWVDNYGYIKEKPMVTYVLDENLSLKQEIFGRFNEITKEGYVLYGAMIYFARCDIETGVQEVYEESWFAGVRGYHKGKIYFNDAYEGAGTSWLVDIDAKAFDLRENDEDYTLLVHPIHQTHLILIDHMRQKVSYQYMLWSGNNISLQEDGLHSDEYDGEVIVPLPDDGVIEIVYGDGL